MWGKQALSYIVFVRGRARFDALFPALEIVHMDVLANYLCYLLSGRLNFKQLFPSVMILAVRWLEIMLSPWSNVLALHQVKVIRRRLGS